jgi:2-iminobutanoate/2-iminopropanoate deaminase
MAMPASRDIKTVRTDRAASPAGHYSQATVANGFVFISGQLPVTADGTPRADAGFDDQARLALGNMLAILDAAGSDPGHLARVTAYIVGVENWPRFNAIYAEMLGDCRPARTVVPVVELHHGCLVEIDAIGAVK